MTHDLLLNIILPLMYFATFAWFIKQYKLFSNDVFSVNDVLIIFLLKTLWCVAYGIYYQRVGYSDTFDMFNASEQIYRSLFRDPRDFFQLVFLPNNIYYTPGVEHYIRAINMYGTEGSYLLLRFHALVRFFSFGSYYVHCVFFSFATLPGIMMLLNYFVGVEHTPRYIVSDGNTVSAPLKRGVKQSFFSAQLKYLLAGVALLIPGIAFWCCGIHKEALVLFSFGLIVQFAGKEKFRIKNLVLLIIGIALLSTVRPLFSLVFAPFILAIILECAFKLKPLVTYFVALVVVVLLVISFHFLRIGPDFISIITHKRIEFMFSGYQTLGRTSSWFYILNNIICAAIIIYLVGRMIVRRFESPVIASEAKQSSQSQEIASPLKAGFAMTAPSDRLQGAMTGNGGLMMIISSLICLIIVGYVVSTEGALSRYEAPLLLLLICSVATTSKKQI